MTKSQRFDYWLFRITWTIVGVLIAVSPLLFLLFSP